MRLILSDRDVRVFEHSPVPVEQILLEEGINPLEVIVSRDGKTAIRGYSYSGER